MFQNLLESNKKVYFLFLCVFTLLLLLVKKQLIEYETSAFLVLDAQGDLGAVKMVSFFQYLSIPLVYITKFLLISLLLWISSFMFGYRITYAQIFGLVIINETLFLLPEIIKIIWFLFFTGEVTIYDIRAFYPFSLMNLFDYKELPDYMHYPLKSLNLFEIIYWITLSFSFHYTIKRKLINSISVVFIGYVFFYLLWLWFYIGVA